MTMNTPEGNAQGLLNYLRRYSTETDGIYVSDVIECRQNLDALFVCTTAADRREESRLKEDSYPKVNGSHVSSRATVCFTGSPKTGSHEGEKRKWDTCAQCYNV